MSPVSAAKSLVVCCIFYSFAGLFSTAAYSQAYRLSEGAQTYLNTDLPGSDLSGQPITLPNPPPGQILDLGYLLCQQACEKNSSCLAWTYVKPKFQGPDAHCWLKNNIPAKVSNPCCNSGTMGEPNTDRFGSDFAHVTSFFSVTVSPSLCGTLCVGNKQCKAWTFVKANIQGPSPVCWLKNTKPAPSHNNCCLSGYIIEGVVR
jgi:hypothetical protein